MTRPSHQLFVVDYVFFRFPRVRLRWDTTARLWAELPTDRDIGTGCGDSTVSGCFFAVYHVY